ncbi:membrane protein [Neisseria sp. 83E34]|nr:membrane protein [Neisseria sp. 83E34]
MLVGILMTVAFGAIYLRITPAEEIRLIRNGNLACALSFGGALVGFCLPLASSISHSVNLPDFMLWGLGAAVIQILVYFAATRIVRDANEELVNNNVAVGALFCAFSISIGLLNAACLS